MGDEEQSFINFIENGQREYCDRCIKLLFRYDAKLSMNIYKGKGKNPLLLQDENGLNAVMRAVNNFEKQHENYYDILEQLFYCDGNNLSMVDNKGNSLLMLLIKKFADLEEIKGTKGFKEELKGWCLAAVKFVYCIEHYQVIDLANKGGDTPLLLASRFEDRRMLKELITISTEFVTKKEYIDILNSQHRSKFHVNLNRSDKAFKGEKESLLKRLDQCNDFEMIVAYCELALKIADKNKPKYNIKNAEQIIEKTERILQIKDDHFDKNSLRQEIKKLIEQNEVAGDKKEDTHRDESTSISDSREAENNKFSGERDDNYNHVSGSDLKQDSANFLKKGVINRTRKRKTDERIDAKQTEIDDADFKFPQPMKMQKQNVENCLDNHEFKQSDLGRADDTERTQIAQLSNGAATIHIRKPSFFCEQECECHQCVGECLKNNPAVAQKGEFFITTVGEVIEQYSKQDREHGLSETEQKEVKNASARPEVMIDFSVKVVPIVDDDIASSSTGLDSISGDHHNTLFPSNVQSLENSNAVSKDSNEDTDEYQHKKFDKYRSQKKTVTLLQTEETPGQYFISSTVKGKAKGAEISFI